METVELKVKSKISKGTVVFVEDGIAKAVEPKHYPCKVNAVFARDVEKGELVEYNPLKNTDDIIINGSVYNGGITGVDTSMFNTGENVYLKDNSLVGESSEDIEAWHNCESSEMNL